MRAARGRPWGGAALGGLFAAFLLLPTLVLLTRGQIGRAHV